MVEDGGRYVECACSHLSVYSASVGASSSYNEAFYAAGFICISGRQPPQSPGSMSGGPRPQGALWANRRVIVPNNIVFVVDVKAILMVFFSTTP